MSDWLPGAGWTLTALVGLGVASTLFGGPAGRQSSSVSVSAAQVTYNRDIAPIIFHSCSTCHRPGEAAPFSLLSYSDAKKHARQIVDVTQSRAMPP